MILLIISLTGLFIGLLAVANLPLIERLWSGLVNSTSNYNFKKISRILIIGESEAANQFAVNSYPVLNHGFINITGFLVNDKTDSNRRVIDGTILGTFEQLETVIVANKINEAIISHEREDLESLFTLVERCNEQKVKVKIYSEMLPILAQKLRPGNHNGVSFISLSGYNKFYTTFGIKRALDLAVGLAVLIILLPLMLVISILIKITSAGPVFFIQTRVGLCGKLFRMYKFRSMYNTNGKDEIREKMMLDFMKLNKSSDSDTKIVDTSRITKLGKFLRKTSLDELPQLINVIKGEMSLVGPRPGTPYEFDNYDKWQKRRVNVLPGCTGLWQVSGRSSVSFNDSVILDLYYVNNVSLLLDLKLLLKTIPVMLFSLGGR